MKVAALSLPQITRLCKSEGLKIKVGPFNFLITSDLPDIPNNIAKLYKHFNLVTTDEIIDFAIDLNKPQTIRRWLKPQVEFKLEGYSPFLPLPLAQAFPFLEWGMNWCIAQNSYSYLTLHAAVVEKNGFTVVLPAQSGSGKSTLTAILVSNGWRLLSDEMTLIHLQTGLVTPLARPISLKNKSISVIKQHNETAIFSNVVDDTNKGTIGHMMAPSESVDRINDTAQISAFIFPKYTVGAHMNLEVKAKGQAFMEVIENSFNYDILGEDAFNALSAVMEKANCFDFSYSDIQDAISTFEHLAAKHD